MGTECTSTLRRCKRKSGIKVKIVKIGKLCLPRIGGAQGGTSHVGRTDAPSGLGTSAIGAMAQRGEAATRDCASLHLVCLVALCLPLSRNQRRGVWVSPCTFPVVTRCIDQTNRHPRSIARCMTMH